MKKFSDKSNEVKKYYKVECKVTIFYECGSDGEAGYLADSDLSSIDSNTLYNIDNVLEISKEEYAKNII